MKNSINALRVLTMDEINEANSGHPGVVLGFAPVAYVLFKEHLKVTPNKADWFNRDRFVMSSGHGSALLYSMLFFPTLFVCYWLMGLVIDNQIFKTRIKSDIPIKL